MNIKTLCSSVALTIATCSLSASIASAQTVHRANFDQRIVPVLRADDFANVRLVSSRPLDDVAWPAAIAAAAAVVKVATVIVHHVTESFLPQPLSLPSRGNLVSLGVYDR